MQQQRTMQFLTLQKPSHQTIQKAQQRPSSTAQISGSQAQTNSAVSMNMKTDQILNQLQTLACSTQAQTENTEKLQHRLQKSEETIEQQKRQNQTLRMENGKIVEQLRLSKCSMEQLEVQVQTLVSKVEDQKNTTREIQEKLVFAENRYEESRAWKDGLEQRLAKAKDEIESIRQENSRVVADLNAEIEAKNSEIQIKNLALQEEATELENLRRNLEHVETQCKARTEETIQLQESLERLKLQNIDLDKELQGSRTDCAEAHAHLDLFKKECEEFSIKNQNLNLELIHAKADFESKLANEKNRLECTLRCVEDKQKEQSELFSNERKALEEKITSVELSCALKDSQLQVFEQQIADFSTKASIDRQDIERMDSENHKMRSQLDFTIEKLQGLENQLHDASEERDRCNQVLSKIEPIVEEFALSAVDQIIKIETLFADIFVEIGANDLKTKASIHSQDAQLKIVEQDNLNLGKLLEEMSFKSSNLENQLRDVEHRADEKIKLNLFEAQKHLNVQIIASREEHALAISGLQDEIASLKEQLSTSKVENQSLQGLLNHSQNLQEQNDHLRSELIRESSKVEQLSKDIHDQRQKITTLQGKLESLTLTNNSQTAEFNRVHRTPESNLDNPGRSLDLSLSSNFSDIQKLKDCRPVSNDVEIESGTFMKKRALGSSSKGKGSNKRNSKQLSQPTHEAPTVRKPTFSTSKVQDHPSWEETCAEFDLFGTSVDFR